MVLWHLNIKNICKQTNSERGWRNAAWSSLSGSELSGVTGGLTGPGLSGLKALAQLMEEQPWVSHLGSGLLSQMTKQPKCPTCLLWGCCFWFGPTTTSFRSDFIPVQISLFMTWNVFAGWCMRKSSGPLNLTSWLLQCPGDIFTCTAHAYVNLQGPHLLQTTVQKLCCVSLVFVQPSGVHSL